ncbi:copper chaperone PCu(A)C [Streptomyces sp. NRRL B-24484]|uniref:copper chaperone PCu(A)C n=1 Tax=Streptomyces sp. NRRL B-24484 TaxID=1463833 RepID=UPI0004C07721|nr:copper chaperone PCu(A)C [Streptomyces sp. NRRL B-24484]
MSRAFRRSALIGAGLSAVLATGTILVACGTGSDDGRADLSVIGSYVPLPALPGGMGAGYLTVRNDGGTADRLVAVTSPDAGSVTMHTSGESTMTAVDSLQVPAHGSLQLARGGHHLMIMGWQKPPAVGDELELDLTFAKSGTISVTVPVKPLTYRPGS